MAWTCGCGPLKMLRKHIGKSSKTLHFWLSDPRSHWVHRKDNTIKTGWGFDHDLVAQMLSDIAPQILKHFSTFHLSKPLNVHLGPTISSLRTHRDEPIHCHMPNPNFSVQPIWILVSPRWRNQVSMMKLLRFGITDMKRSKLLKWRLALAIALRSHRDVLFSLTETSNVQIFCTSRSHREFYLVSPSWVKDL